MKKPQKNPNPILKKWGCLTKKIDKKRGEQNEKRLEELNLVHLYISVNNNFPPKTSPVISFLIFVDEEDWETWNRRKKRWSPCDALLGLLVILLLFMLKNYGVKGRDLSDRVFATEEERAYTIEEAERLESKLKEEGFPTPHQTHASFSYQWWFLACHFRRSSLPRCDGLVDEESEEFPAVFLASKNRLRGGWKGFAQFQELVDGDTVIFQVYITKSSGLESVEDIACLKAILCWSIQLLLIFVQSLSFVTMSMVTRVAQGDHNFFLQVFRRVRVYFWLHPMQHVELNLSRPFRS